MGVKGLWELLSDAKTDVNLAELRGLTLAVDLSGWICQLKSVPGLPNVQPLRSLFYRTTHLMNLGVKLVFVMDGVPPELKRDAMEQRQASRGSLSKERQSFSISQSVMKARQLLESLGLPCLDAPGEAEALCAHLSQLQLVDGCLTQDGDALLYGAKKVYKNFSLDKQARCVECYCAEHIEESLGLTRRDLISLALLTGCDYNMTGVRQVGKEKATNLIKHLKSKKYDVLDRICKWRDCPDLDVLEKERQQKCTEHHCSQCQHLGTIAIHKVEGCGLCMTDEGCTCAPKVKGNGHHGNKHNLCPCDWHVTNRRVRDNLLELNVREKALQQEDFPFMNVVNEFLQTPQASTVQLLKWRKPNLQVFVKNCSGILGWKEAEVVDKLLSTLVWSDLKAKEVDGYFSDSQETDDFLQPLQILKSCRKNFTPCYEVTWKRLKSDIWSEKQRKTYSSIVEQKMFATVFKQMVQEYEEGLEKQKAAKLQERKTKAGELRVKRVGQTYCLGVKWLLYYKQLNLTQNVVSAGTEARFCVVVNEFLQTPQASTVQLLKWRKPNLQVFVKNCSGILGWKEAEVVDKLLSTLVWSDLKAKEVDGYFSDSQETDDFLQPLQ
ncbi:flap endonuclease GEN homolog 1-like [Liolophura sinensis]|uniref:flap endonuclease GEN homolog 1-like n=1 Tax=Liolophura sinensis TaxID=3198878 RepID=UPI003158C7B7